MESSLAEWTKMVCRKYSRIIGSNWVDEEDLLQEAWVVWIEVNRRYEGEQIVRLYRRSLRNRFISMLRYHNAKVRAGEESLEQMLEEDGEQWELFGFEMPETVVAKELATILVSRLEEDEISVLRGRLLGMTNKEISKALGLKRSEVVALRASVVGKFKKLLEELD